MHPFADGVVLLSALQGFGGSAYSVSRSGAMTVNGMKGCGSASVG
jgi:hypothetical protein